MSWREYSSAIALDLILGLTQKREGARLADLATAANTTLSAAQVAVRLLLADRLVEREPGRRPRYRLRREHPTVAALIELTVRSTAPAHALDVILRANPAVRAQGCPYPEYTPEFERMVALVERYRTQLGSKQ